MNQRNNLTSDCTFKYILVGDASVGKTKISYRFRTDKFDNDYQVTLNVEFTNHIIVVDDFNVNIELWDTSGDKNFRAIQKGYYKSSVCALVVYDITQKSSFDNAKDWLDQCKDNGNPSETLILVGNKCDLEKQRAVPKEEAEEFAKNNNMLFYETSALTGVNIQKMFQDSAKKIIANASKDVYNLSDEDCGIKVKKTFMEKIKKNKPIPPIPEPDPDPNPCDSCKSCCRCLIF